MSMLPFKNKEIVQKEMVDLLPRLRRFARGLTENSFEADDLVQTACEKALKKNHQYKTGTRLDSWLYRIVHTSWLDELRRKKVRVSHLYVVKGEMQRSSKFSGTGRVNTFGKAIDLKKALNKLSYDHRVALVLVSVEGYSYTEAAGILGIAAGTVASRVARARATMNDLLKNQDAKSPKSFTAV